jgi:hypothetical protein
MTASPDRLFDLLPVVYRLRDAATAEANQPGPLQSLLRVIAGQVEVVEDDIGRMYDNWFIETCEDWVVPYIAELIGYRPVSEAGRAGDPRDPDGAARNRRLVPRREVAGTLGFRRRKGTLALLELLAADVAGWPARAVELYRNLLVTQPINHLRLQRGRTVDVRHGATLDLIDGPVDRQAHTVDVRRPTSLRTRGRHNIPSVALFIWRLRPYSVTRTPAYCDEDQGAHCYTFSVLGNDGPLFTRPLAQRDPWTIAGEANLPTPNRRRGLEAERPDYRSWYGPDRSFQIWLGRSHQPVPPDKIVIADLTNWHYRPLAGTLAVDPVLGRIAFPPRHAPREGVRVSYHYGFSDDLGGGEYHRPIREASQARIYRVGEGETYLRIRDALEQWQQDRGNGALPHAVIEIGDSGVYVEQLTVELRRGEQLQIRAADHRRPVLRLLDWQTGAPDALSVRGATGSRFTLDGLLITGRGIEVHGKLACLALRHTTLVPGWGIGCDCEPRRPAEPSLTLTDFHGKVTIERSILGSIQVNANEVRSDPVPVTITDSILDATGPEREAIGAPGCLVAPVVLTVRRTTVFGKVQVHAIQLGENSIFDGLVTVGRRQLGCLRFCYADPRSRTPRRYHCQPFQAEEAVEEALRDEAAGLDPPVVPDGADITRARELERERVRPRFNSVRYGTPTYAQLADWCPPEISRGADDESEMGAFHDLFQPQREANLRARLEEFTPAGSDAGVIHAS